MMFKEPLLHPPTLPATNKIMPEDPLQTPPSADGTKPHHPTHMDIVLERLTETMELFRKCTTLNADSAASLRLKNVTSQLTSALAFLPLGNQRNDQYKLLMLYICRFLLLLSRIAELTCAPDHDFHQHLESFRSSLRQELELKGTVPRYQQVGYSYTVTCEHIVDIFNYNPTLLIPGSWWAVRAAAWELEECVRKVKLVCQQMECGVGCKLLLVAEPAPRGVLYVARTV